MCRRWFSPLTGKPTIRKIMRRMILACRSIRLHFRIRSHTISALVRLQDGTTQTISSACIVDNPIVGSGETSSLPSSVSLSANIASPQTEGTSVTFTASATGGSGSYEYKFWEQSPATNWQWVVVREFGASNTFTWNTAGKVGTSQIGVWVRNAGTDFNQNLDQTKYITSYIVEEASLPSSVTLSTNIASPQTEGTSVTFTASATGGSGSYEYKFWEQSPVTNWQWVVVREFGASNTFTWNTRQGKLARVRLVFGCAMQARISTKIWIRQNISQVIQWKKHRYRVPWHYQRTLRVLRLKAHQ